MSNPLEQHHLLLSQLGLPSLTGSVAPREAYGLNPMALPSQLGGLPAPMSMFPSLGGLNEFRSAGSRNPVLDLSAKKELLSLSTVNTRRDPVTGTGTDDYAGSSLTTGVVNVGGEATGVVNASGDRDWFRVQLEAGRTYRFNLNGDTLSDPTLVLRNSSGAELSYNDDSGEELDSEITFTAVTGGTYYLDAGAYADETGTYTVVAEDVPPTIVADDDYAGDGSTSGSLSVDGGEATGEVQSDGDRDWFRIQLEAGRTYLFNLNGDTLSDPILVLRDSSGAELSYDDDSGEGLNSEIAFTALTSGTYYLDVGAYADATGSYTLHATKVTLTDDYAGDSSTSGSLSVGGEATGELEDSGDQDWFRIQLEAGRTYRFNLNGDTLSDPTLTLRDSNGAQLAYNDDSGEGFNSEIAFTALTSGTYYLDAGGYYGTGSYRLRAVEATPTDDFASDSSTRGRISVGSTRTGAVNASGDRDWFQISLTAGRTYRFNLNGTTLSDPTLVLRDSSGAELSSNDDFGAGLNSQITFRATTTGIYYLDAGSYGSGTGSYTLRVATQSGPQPTRDDYAADTTTTGNLSVGGVASGVIERSGDHDWFSIGLVEGRTYRFNLNGTTLSDPTLALHDSNGDQLAYNDDYEGGRDSEITFTATATGTYYLDASGFSARAGSYQLEAADITSDDLPADDDYAGNDSTRGRLIVGEAVTGVVNDDGDRDWFGLALEAGRIYTFRLDADADGTLTDPELYLRRADGGELAHAQGSGGSNSSVITFTCNVAGTYYLDAGAVGGVGRGTYTLLAEDVLGDDDFEANTDTRGTLRVGETAAGAVNFIGDRDWLAITLEAGRSYRFNLRGVTLNDTTLALRDGEGVQLGFSDNSGDRSSEITFTSTTTGTYYLDAGGYSAEMGSYTLTAATTSVTTDDYRADTATTGSITVGRQASGAIDFVNDRDWFEVMLEAGRTYRFNLNGTTLSDPTLRLLDGEGRRERQTNNDFGSGKNSQITFTAAATGKYYLEAGAVGDLRGLYELTAVDITANDSSRIDGLADSTIRAAVNTALRDNLFSHQELVSLLRTTASGGVSDVEFSDLRLISRSLSPYLNTTSRSYTQYIFNAVVNGNAANQWWTGGQSERVALGNLAAGATQEHLGRLVDKWFGGLDRPTNYVGGDTAAAAGSLSFTYGRMSGSLFVNDISFSDVNQGQAGTCYFLAASATLANNRSDVIRDMFVANGDGTYGVRFYGSTGQELWVTVDQLVPVVNGRPVLAGNSTRSLNGEMWVALAEKAYAQANEIGQFGRPTAANSYSAVEGGLEEALSHLSNRPTTTVSAYFSNGGWRTADNNRATWNSYLPSAIAAVAAGRSLWLGSFEDTFDSSGKRNFVAGHAFAITGYNSTTQRFTIANPWGAGNSSFAGVFEATWSDLFGIRAVVSWA